MELTSRAQVMILVMAANGGEMEKDDLFRECERVWNLSPEERKLWESRVLPLGSGECKKEVGITV